MLSNQKSSRLYSVKGFAFIAIALALLMSVTAFASGNSRLAFIDSATEFFGLQTSIASVFSNAPANSTEAAPAAASRALVDVAVSLPVVSNAPGPVSIPITVGDLTGLGVISYDLQITFDPAVLTPAAISTTQSGTMSNLMTVTPNTTNPGHFILSVFHGQPMCSVPHAPCPGGGTLVILNFDVIGGPGTSSTLVFENYTSPAPSNHPAFVFNEGDPVANPITNGNLSVPVGPTATDTPTFTPTPSATETFTPSNTATNTSTPTPSGTSTNTSTPTPTPLCVQVDIDDKDGINGQPITISVMTTTTNAQIPPIFSTDFHVSYDPTVLATAAGPFYGVVLGTAPPPGAVLTVNHPSAGLLEISVFATDPWTSVGLQSIVDINFPNVTGAPGTFSPINFTPWDNDADGFKYNEGFPTSCLQNGSVTVRGTMSGNIKYRPAGVPDPRPIPNTTVTSFGAPPNPAPVLTDTLGNYSLSGFGPFGYTIIPTRPGSSAPNTRGTSVTAFDAAITAQHVVHLITLSANQQFVADVTGVDNITSLDSAQMARWAVSLPLTDFTGDWRFQPSSRSYAFVGSLTAEDYVGFLMGDVSGNWCDPTTTVLPCSALGSIGGSGRPARGPERATAVRAPHITAPAGSDVVVPVTVQGATDKGIIAYQFDLRYDPSVIQPQADAVSLAGTVSGSFSVVANAETPGLLKVAVYGPFALNESGVLLNFNFTAVGSPFSVSPLTWENFMFNEGGIRMNIIDGQVVLSAAVPNTTADEN